MLTTTTNYDTENAKDAKQPCAIIEFNGVATKFASNDFSGISSSYKKLIKKITYESSGWNPFEVFFEKSRVVFTLSEDENNTVLGLVSNNILINDTVTVKLGFTNLAESDFVSLPTFEVKKIKLEGNLQDHTFICEEYSELNRIFDETIISNIPTTNLTANVTNSDTIFNVGDTSDFIDPTSVPDGLARVAVIVAGEICTYTGKTTTTLTGLTRGYGSTVAAEHSQGELVKQCFIFGTQGTVSGNENDNFAQVLLRALTGTDAGTNGVYDPGITNFGLGIDESLIDIEQIEREGYRFHAARSSYYLSGYERFEYYLYEDMKASDFIKDLLYPFHAVLYMGSDGKIKLKVLDIIQMLEDILDETLNDTNSILESIEFLDNELITKIKHRYNWRPIERIYDYVSTYTNTDAQTAYNATNRKIIDNKGLRRTNNLDRFHSLERFFLFYDNMRCKLRVTSKMKNWLYEPLDVIKFTSSMYPNWDNGDRTWNEQKIMVMKKNVAFAAGEFSVSYDLFAFDLVNKNSNTYTLYKYIPSPSSLSYNSDFDETVNAEDAYRQFSTPISVYGNSYAKLSIVIPNGTDTEQWLDLGMVSIDSTNVMIARNATRVRYNSSWDKTITVWIPLISGEESSAILKYLKVDWFGRSTTVAGDLPTITVEEIWTYKKNYSY